jgi:hypothetical protein
MTIDELIAYVQNITSVGPDVDASAVSQAQYSALASIEGNRRSAHQGYLEDAYVSLVNDEPRRTPADVALRARAYANAMIEEWDAIMVVTFKRGKELRDKFNYDGKQRGEMKEKH